MSTRSHRFTQARATLLTALALVATAGCTRQIAVVPRLSPPPAPTKGADAPVEAAKPVTPAVPAEQPMVPEAPAAEAPRPEAPKPETPPAEAPKPEAPKPVAPEPVAVAPVAAAEAPKPATPAVPAEQPKTPEKPQAVAPKPVEPGQRFIDTPPVESDAEKRAHIRETAAELARIQREEAEAKAAAAKAEKTPPPPPAKPTVETTPAAACDRCENAEETAGDDCCHHDDKATPPAAPKVAPVLALARDFEAFVALAPAKAGERVIVQVNRVLGSPEVADVDRGKITDDLTNAFSHSTRVMTTRRLYGDAYTGQPKAIHLAFDTESRSLGLLPTNDLRQAPAIILSSRVTTAPSGRTLVISAVDAKTGKTVWTGTSAL